MWRVPGRLLGYTKHSADRRAWTRIRRPVLPALRRRAFLSQTGRAVYRQISGLVGQTRRPMIQFCRSGCGACGGIVIRNYSDICRPADVRQFPVGQGARAVTAENHQLSSRGGRSRSSHTKAATVKHAATTNRTSQTGRLFSWSDRPIDSRPVTRTPTNPSIQTSV